MEDTKSCPYCAEQILVMAIKCKHCASNLLTATGDGSEVIRPLDLGFLILGLPLVTTILLYLWVGNMSLLSDPGSVVSGLLLVTIVGTAVLAAIEAGVASTRGTSEPGTHGPVAWLLIISLLWIVGFPAYCLKRGRLGLARCGASAMAVMAAFLIAYFWTVYDIESRKAELRGAAIEWQQEWRQEWEKLGQ